jgi:hypothetical protein
MTLFHVLEYSPLVADHELARRLPIHILRKWFRQAYYCDMVMLDPADMNNHNFREESEHGMIADYNKVWFIDSLRVKNKVPEALAILKSILLYWDGDDESI